MKADKIEQILREEQLWCDCYEMDGKIYMEIDGDWKHEHLRAKLILADYGYNVIEVYHEESECDWYEARYIVLENK